MIPRTIPLFGLLLTGFFIVLWSPAQAGLLNIQEVKSAGGLTAWLVEDHSIPVLSMDFGFKGAGSAQDPQDRQGLARMASNTMDEGAGDLDSQAFQGELQNRVIALQFGATRDHFTGSLKTLTKNKDRAFALLQMALTQPRFDSEAIRRMSAANQSRIRSSLSEPDWIAARLQNDKAYAGHPYTMNSGGTLTSLSKISRSDLRNFHKTLLGKNNLVVAVAGDITPQELAIKLDETFGLLPAVTVPPVPDLTLQNQGKTYLYRQDIPQTVIEILQPGIAQTDPRYHSAQVLNFVLGSSGFGSRLTEEIREKRGLTYGIYSALNTMDHLDTLSVSSSTANANVAPLLSLIKTEFNRLKTAPVSATEITDAKNYLVGSLPLSLTSTDKISGLLLSLRLDDLPMDYLDRREKAIKATSLEDLKTLAQTLLTPEHFVTILLGNPPETHAGPPTPAQPAQKGKEKTPEKPQKTASGFEMIDTIPNVE